MLKKPILQFQTDYVNFVIKNSFRNCDSDASSTYIHVTLESERACSKGNSYQIFY